jgi:hypothetical protein
MAVVVGAQVLWAILYAAKGRLSFSKVLLSIIFTSGLAYYYISTSMVLNIDENLSSNIRFGSTILSINAALSGYAISGIGIGQFHFFYRDVFAPDFLFATKEGLNQLSLYAESRASTFNLYTRILLEFGVIGLITSLLMIVSLLRTRITQDTLYIMTLYTGSLGFLMTQDTYFYPPLILSIALLLGVRYAATSVNTT